MKETNKKLDKKNNFQPTLEDYIPRILSESDAGIICVQTSTPTIFLRKNDSLHKFFTSFQLNTELFSNQFSFSI